MTTGRPLQHFDNRIDGSADLIAEMQAYYERRASWYDSSMRYDDVEFIRSLEPVFEVQRA